MRDAVLRYEELSLNAHPALQTELYDGWVLRFANGYTNRANSVSPLYPSALSLETKIDTCEKRYFTRGLPSVFKLTDETDPRIDRALAERGYAVVTPTHVMEMDLRGKEFPPGDCIITDYADDAWFDAYFFFSEYTDSLKMDTARQILANVRDGLRCGRLMADGAPVACASLVIERGCMGLLNVVVDPSRRGMGYGTALCAAMLAQAVGLGAHTAYLQVVRDNQTAVHLYEKLGYKTLYSYWYRLKKESDPCGQS